MFQKNCYAEGSTFAYSVLYHINHRVLSEPILIQSSCRKYRSTFLAGRKIYEYPCDSVQISQGFLERNLDFCHLLPLCSWINESENGLPLIKGNNSLLLKEPVPFLLHVCPSFLLHQVQCPCSHGVSQFSDLIQQKSHPLRKKEYIFFSLGQFTEILQLFDRCNLQEGEWGEMKEECRTTPFWWPSAIAPIRG